MKNGSTFEQLKVQKQDILSSEKEMNQDKDGNQDLNTNRNIITKQERHTSTNPFFNLENNPISSSFISLTPSVAIFPANHEKQMPKPKKKKEHKL